MQNAQHQSDWRQQKESFSEFPSKATVLRAMQNNLDLIREILAQIRDCNHLSGFAVKVTGYEELVVARHVERLVNDGFIDVSARFRGMQVVSSILVKDLTSDGHALLASLEDEDVINQFKAAVSPKEIGKLSIRKIGNLIMDLAEQGLRRKLGLD